MSENSFRQVKQAPISQQVEQTDDDQTVLSKILDQLELSGQSDVESLMTSLRLYANPKGGHRLKSAISDGMIDVTDDGHLKINSYGHKMARILKERH